MTRITGACRLHTGTQREQIYLERDLVDYADDLADLLRRLLDLAHRTDRLPDDFPGLLGIVLGLRPNRRHENI